jgi:hypothetical protein
VKEHKVRKNPTLAGIIRISPELTSQAAADTTLADFFENWGAGQAALWQQPPARAARLDVPLSGPRQHKLRANLDQIRAELAYALAAAEQYG